MEILNKLSNTSVDKYMECSLCYYLHYIERVRPKRGKSALLFGKALDTALNDLLINRNLDQALNVFKDNWENAEINGEKIYAPTSQMITYFKSDLDQELLDYYATPLGKQSPEWTTLSLKGDLFIKQYYKDILPKIKEVIAVQEPVSLKNEDGDEIHGVLDLIVKWEDGKTYLMDNKSSSSKYEPDSTKTGQQLPLYYYMVKEKYQLDGVGYIVLSKKINKNKVKKCMECGTLNTSTHKTCNNQVTFKDMNTTYDIERCGGKFDVSITPSVDFDVILNTVDEKDEQRVIDKFDEVNYNIKNFYFATEHNPKRGKYGFCQYNDYYDGNPDYIKLPKKEKKSEEESA